MKLTAENVTNVFMACLFKDGEPTETYKTGEGVKTKAGFHPERLKDAEPDIISMLSELPNEFKKTGGGGWSFLNMCQDKNGNQWADFHKTMDELVILGNAIEKVKFQLPKEMWDVLPGGMPYLVVDC